MIEWSYANSIHLGHRCVESFEMLSNEEMKEINCREQSLFESSIGRMGQEDDGISIVNRRSSTFG